ncbi:MAG: hypothetical protein ACUVRD_07025 [Bacteroidia bacterium]
MNTPVLILAYKRVDTLSQVWKILQQVKPPRVYVHVDGPKHAQEAPMCQAVQNFVQENFTWPGKLYTYFQSTNQGCQAGVVAGISWFFAQEEEGIILEDDTLPSIDFFSFCETLLARYKHDKEILTISGSNFLPQNWFYTGDYYFMRTVLIWGWATWQDRWAWYDPKIPVWETLRETPWLSQLFPFQKRLQKAYFQTYESLTHLDAWGPQMTFWAYLLGKKNIFPRRNLVRNIGTGHQASTHTKKVSPATYLPLGNLKPPYQEPIFKGIDLKAELYTHQYFIYRSIWRRALWRFLLLVNAPQWYFRI